MRPGIRYRWLETRTVQWILLCLACGFWGVPRGNGAEASSNSGDTKFIAATSQSSSKGSLDRGPGFRKASEDAAATAFFEGPPRIWELTVPEHSLARLRSAPREFAPARVRVGGIDYGEVGIHIKGSAGSLRTIDSRPALTLKWNRYQKGKRFEGLEKVHLNNGAQDSSLMNEILTGRIYRAAGIPTTRATHGFLRMNGRDLGTYVVKEAFDEWFVRRQFPEDSTRPGNLYEGGFLNDIDRKLQLDAGDGDSAHRDLRQLLLATMVDKKERMRELNRILAVDEFLTFAALQLCLDERDGYLRNRNNYRIYFRRSDGRAVFLPSGMDQVMRDTEGPVRDSWVSLVPNALFGLPDQRLRLRDRMRELTRTILTEGWMVHELDQMQSRVDDAIRNLPDSHRPELVPDAGDVKHRIRQRLATVARELADWPDPLPPWPKGKFLIPAGWTSYVQTGDAKMTTNATSEGWMSLLHVRVLSPKTRASFRTHVVVPAGSYRVSGWVRTLELDPFSDDFGKGVAVRLTGNAATETVSGSAGWTEVGYNFEHPGDGPTEILVEARANSGEAWFDPSRIRITAR